MNDHSHDVGIDKAGFIHDGGADSSSPVLRVEGGQGFSPIQVGGEGRYSLLLKGGRVIDPAQEISEERDVAISGSKIARVAKNIAESEAKQVLDVRGKIVTPGLIDVHVHVYDGVVPFGIPADPNCIAKGVTTVVDAGSAGAHTFPGFRRFVVSLSSTRVYALLNLSVIGMSCNSISNQWGELLDLRYAIPKLAMLTIEKNRDLILGIKVRLGRKLSGDNDFQALTLAREAADAFRMPIMLHIERTCLGMERATEHSTSQLASRS